MTAEKQKVIDEINKLSFREKVERAVEAWKITNQMLPMLVVKWYEDPMDILVQCAKKWLEQNPVQEI